MNKLFNNLSIVKMILIVSCLPLIGLILMSILSVKEVLHDEQSADKTLDVVKLASILDGVAHNHAVERGLTAGFLGSGGQKNGEKVKAQRLKADEAANKVFNLKASDFNALDFELIQTTVAPLKAALANKADVRKKVDQLAPNSNAFGFYSSVNTEALSAIRKLTSQINAPELKTELDNILTLLWVKERAGQIRGKLNGIFAKGTVDSRNYYEVLGYIRDETSLIKEFNRFADSETKQAFGKLTQKDNWSQVNRIQQQFKAHPDTGEISDPTGGKWFELATSRIVDIKKYGDSYKDTFAEKAQAHDNALIYKAFAEIALSATLTIAVIVLILLFIPYINQRVKAIHDLLEKVNNDNDLTLKLNEDAHNELGDIAKAINKHLHGINTIFSDFKRTSGDALNSTREIANHSESSKSNAESQRQQTDQMSYAVSELLTTANDIASNMNQAKDSMVNAADNAQKSRNETGAVSQIFSRLINDFSENLHVIEALDQHSQDISTILDTISGIAEQTNLLALNAAIEAARAGEQGRGFAVVADEVRSLAQKTQESTANIREMIERLGSSSQQALNSMRSSQQCVTDTETRVKNSDAAVMLVNDEIQKMQDLINLVATAADEQSHVISDINDGMSQTNSIANNTVTNIQSVDSTAKQLAQKFGELDQRIQRFKV